MAPTKQFKIGNSTLQCSKRVGNPKGEILRKKIWSLHPKAGDLASLIGHFWKTFRSQWIKNTIPVNSILDKKFHTVSCLLQQIHNLKHLWWLRKDIFPKANKYVLWTLFSFHELLNENYTRKHLSFRTNFYHSRSMIFPPPIRSTIALTI